LSLKHVDPVLKGMGISMAKSRNVEKAAPEPVKVAPEPVKAAPEPVKAAPEPESDKGAERAPRPGSNSPEMPASQASAKQDAERAIAADRANGTGQKAAPDSAERAERALVNSALAKTAKAKAAEQAKGEQAKATLAKAKPGKAMRKAA
jgi:hypothetical protein